MPLTKVEAEAKATALAKQIRDGNLKYCPACGHDASVGFLARARVSGKQIEVTHIEGHLLEWAGATNSTCN